MSWNKERHDDNEMKAERRGGWEQGVDVLNPQNVKLYCAAELRGRVGPDGRVRERGRRRDGADGLHAKGTGTITKGEP